MPRVEDVAAREVRRYGFAPRDDEDVVLALLTIVKRYELGVAQVRRAEMAAEWICDGCGKRAPGVPTPLSGWHKPALWYERNVERKADGTEADFGERGYFAGILTACSRECIGKVAEKTGTHDVVLPV